MRIGAPSDWLRLARISNLPTTWTNVLVGAAIVARRPDLDALVGAAAVTSILYVGGMILNDVVDAPRDRRRGLGRPIPAGRISRGIAATVAIACLAGGPLLAAGLAAGVAGGEGEFGSGPALWAAALAACIVGYDFLKERAAAALVLMGACRGLIIPLAASLQVSATGAGEVVLPVLPVAIIGAALATYVTMVTVIARGEHDAPPTRGGREPGATAGSGLTWRLAGPPALAILVLLAMPTGAVGAEPAITGGLAVFVAAAWTSFTVRRLQDDGVVPRAVVRWLAGICLFDAALLGTLGAHWSLLVVAGLCFGLTRLAQRRIAGS